MLAILKFLWRVFVVGDIAKKIDEEPILEGQVFMMNGLGSVRIISVRTTLSGQTVVRYRSGSADKYSAEIGDFRRSAILIDKKFYAHASVRDELMKIDKK